MKSKLLSFLLSVALFCAAYLSHYFFEYNTSSVISDFEEQLHKKEKHLNNEIKLLEERLKTESYNALFAQKPVYYNSLFDKEGLALLIYENDSLKYWSDNSIAVENWRKEVCLDTKIIKLQNGWFEVVEPTLPTSNGKSIIGLILIKNEYPYQNKYLTNTFQKDFHIPVNAKLIPDSSSLTHPIKDLNNNYLFSIQLNSVSNASASYIEFTFNLFAVLLLILFLEKMFHPLNKKIENNQELILFSTSLIFIRYLSLKFLFPNSFYEFDLFSPKIYADASSIWLSSLGDLFINTLLLFFIVYNFTQRFKFQGRMLELKNKNKVIFSSLLLFIFFVGWRIVSYVIIGLVNNSNISFDLDNIFSLNQYSYIALIIITLLLLLCFFVTDKIIYLLKQNSLNTQQIIFIYFLSIVLYLLLLIQSHNLNYVNILMPITLLFILMFINRKDGTYSFTKIVILVFLFSYFAEHLLDKYTDEKEIESRKIIAEKIAAEQDPVAEYLFNDIDNKIKNDTLLISYVGAGNNQYSDFEKRLREIYFSGFWEKYDMKVSYFDNQCAPVIQQSNAVYDNNLYFDELITKKSSPTSSKHLFFLHNTNGKISYLARIELCDSTCTVKYGKLYIELDAKLNSNEIGFPELLLDKKLTPSDEFDNYSYAKYRNANLVNQFGKFPYNSSDIDFYKNGETFYVENKDDYIHLLYQPDLNTTIIVSKRNEGLSGRITTFSYLFTFFSLLLLLLFFIRQATSGTLLGNLSFKYRIQLLLVSIVLISLVLFGGGTVYYIKQQFKTKNKDNISEKIHSVLVDIENKLGNENYLKEALSEYSTFMLEKSSNIFFTDINLYDSKGNLYVTSRPKIFDKGLISRKMNAEAYLQMAVLGKREFTHDEKIGKLEYLSSYIQFQNKDGKLLGYLNLPYFSKQNELEKEISGFLVALINIYVLLFVLSIVMAVIISNIVTQPLRLIQDKLSKIKLGKINELIEWKDKDEIGSLVSEYNRMILELSQSAELLAKSEREGAWREMAKQVAHEIKNPLTPMKLSIQHLQRLQNDDSKDMEQKIKQLTDTLIEQIDALSNIATEFSNFAKMPKANLEQVNVNDVLSNTIALFKDSENIQIEFKNSTSSNALVLADKEQLLRVFNNLIKNAVQSISSDRKGKIEVSLSKENQQCLISVKDNGAGISDENIQKIFVPNFTTKTTGMGLGLAMVKNIIESISGKIWFERNSEQGTTFYLSLPCHHSDK